MSDDKPLPLWDDAAFRARVTQLAEQRGRSISEICLAAGLSASYLAKPAGRAGRSIEALMRIARELEVSVIEIVGSINYHDADPSDDNLARLSLVAEIAAYLYVALGARRHIAPTRISSTHMIAEILRIVESSPAKE